MSLSRWCPIWMHLEGLLIWLDYRFCQLVWFLFTDFDCLGAAAAAAFFSGKIVYKPNCSQKTKNIPPKFYPSRPIVPNFFKSRPPSSICPTDHYISSCKLSFRQPLTNRMLLSTPIALLPHHICKVFRFSSSLHKLK